MAEPPFPAPGTVATVGAFDGLHRGHWAVLRQVRRRAAERGEPGLVLTFEPHPLRVLRPEHAPRLLTPPREQREILALSGIPYAAVLAFTPALADTPPRTFVEEILVGRFRLAHLVIGYDHGFGRGRAGDVELLRRLGTELGFDVDVVPPVLLDGEPISSRRIRRLLEEGRVETAAAALGRPYSFEGTVVPGDGRGRTLGCPTANLEVAGPDKLLPAPGIYAVRAALGAELRDGVLHLGPRPTFPGAPPSVELHLLDFEGDLYGARLKVELCARLRAIEPFPDAATLRRAMEADIAAARHVLAAGAAACGLAREELD